MHASNPFESVASPVTAGVTSPAVPMKYVWKEWEMMIRKKETSHIHVNGMYAIKRYFCRVRLDFKSTVEAWEKRERFI